MGVGAILIKKCINVIITTSTIHEAIYISRLLLDVHFSTYKLSYFDVTLYYSTIDRKGGGDLSLHFPGMVEKKMAVFFVFWVFFVVVYIKEVFREVFYQGGAVQCWNVLDCSQG